MPLGNDALRVIREQRGLSVRALAAEVGVAPSTISRLESGQRVGSLSMVARIADVLEVDAELLGGLSGEQVSA